MAENEVILDIWGLRALLELGYGTFTLKEVEAKRTTITKTSFHKLYYLLKYPSIKIVQ